MSRTTHYLRSAIYLINKKRHIVYKPKAKINKDSNGHLVTGRRFRPDNKDKLAEVGWVNAGCTFPAATDCVAWWLTPSKARPLMLSPWGSDTPCYRARTRFVSSPSSRLHQILAVAQTKWGKSICGIWVLPNCRGFHWFDCLEKMGKKELEVTHPHPLCSAEIINCKYIDVNIIWIKSKLNNIHKQVI